MSEIYDDLDELPAPPRVDILPADRELLELAARAIGATFEEVDGEGYGRLHFPDGTVVGAWNSLAFSDDAFALQVDLLLNVYHDSNLVDVHGARGRADFYATEEIGEDRKAAARRAITRTAAEMAKRME